MTRARMLTKAIMKLMRTLAAMVALSVTHHANAAETVQTLDAKIADAKRTAAEAKKTDDTICFDAGKEMGQRELGQPNDASEKFKKCTSAMQTSSDANGLIGVLYEQRSHLTGEPLAPEYACIGKPSLGAPHPGSRSPSSVRPLRSSFSRPNLLQTALFQERGKATNLNQQPQTRSQSLGRLPRSSRSKGSSTRLMRSAPH
jgi:hypothetical protein